MVFEFFNLFLTIGIIFIYYRDVRNLKIKIFDLTESISTKDNKISELELLLDLSKVDNDKE